MRQGYVLMTSDSNQRAGVGVVAVYATELRAQQMLEANRAENLEAHFWVKRVPLVSESDFHEYSHLLNGLPQ